MMLVNFSETLNSQAVADMVKQIMVERNRKTIEDYKKLYEVYEWLKLLLGLLNSIEAQFKNYEFKAACQVIKPELLRICEELGDVLISKGNAEVEFNNETAVKILNGFMTLLLSNLAG